MVTYIWFNITWTNVDWSSTVFCDNPLRVNSQEVSMNLMHSMCSDITLLKSLKHLPGGQWVKPSKCTMVYHKVVIYDMCERKQPVPVAGHLPTKGFGYCRKTPALRGHIAGVGEVGVPVAAKIYGQYRQCWSTRYCSIVMMRNRTW